MIQTLQPELTSIATAGSEALCLRIPAAPLDPSRFAAALPALASQRISFEIVSDGGDVSLMTWASPSRLAQVASFIPANWPGINVSLEPAASFATSVVGWRLRTRLPDAFPLLAQNDKHFDLPSALTILMARCEDVSAAFQLVLAPASSLPWREEAMAKVEALTRRQPEFLPDLLMSVLNVRLPQPEIPKWLSSYQEVASNKAATPYLFQATVRFIATGGPGASLRSVAMRALELVTNAFAGGPNGFEAAPLSSAEQLVAEFNQRQLTQPAVLSASEVSSLWHPPTQLQDAAELRSSLRLFTRGGHVPVPKTIPVTGVIIGYDPSRDGRAVALPPASLRQQTAIIGATGTGKSTSGLTIFLSAQENDMGGLLLDVKGDLALDAIGPIRPDKVDDVFFLDGADEASQLSIDPMALARGLDRDLATDILLSNFHREFRDSWGVVIERLMKASVRALLETDGTTLLDLPRFLRDKRYRESILSAVTDEMVRDYFALEFEPMGASRQLQAVSPVLNRVGAALESAVGRRLFGRPANLDLVALKREGQLLVARFPQGQIGERNANIAASLTLTSSLFAAMTLAGEPEGSRREWVAVCDEMQNYANASFTKAFSEGRSFGFCLVACTQFLGAVPPDVRSAILANANTLICFRLGEEDAALIGRRFEPALTRVQLTDLDNYVAAVRTSVNGERLPPFTMRVQPPVMPWRQDIADLVRANTRRERRDVWTPTRPRLVTLPRPTARTALLEIEEEDA